MTPDTIRFTTFLPLTCPPGPALDVADAGHVQPHVPVTRRAAPVSAAGAPPRVTRGQGGGGDTHARPVAWQIRPEGESYQADDVMMAIIT